MEEEAEGADGLTFGIPARRWFGFPRLDLPYNAPERDMFAFRFDDNRAAAVVWA